MGRLTPLGRRVNVASDPAGDQVFASADVLADGSTLVRWTENNGVTRAERFDADGDRLGEAVALPGKFAPLISGDMVSLDFHQRSATVYDLEIRAQRYDSSGAALGEPVTVNTRPISFYVAKTIKALPNGGFIAVWENE